MSKILMIFFIGVIVALGLWLLGIGIYCDVRVLQDVIFHTYDCGPWEIIGAIFLGGTGPIVGIIAANN